MQTFTTEAEIDGVEFEEEEKEGANLEASVRSEQRTRPEMLIVRLGYLRLEDREEELRKMALDQLMEGPILYENYRDEGVPEHTNAQNTESFYPDGSPSLSQYVASDSNMSVDSVERQDDEVVEQRFVPVDGEPPRDDFEPSGRIPFEFD